LFEELAEFLLLVWPGGAGTIIDSLEGETAGAREQVRELVEVTVRRAGLGDGVGGGANFGGERDGLNPRRGLERLDAVAGGANAGGKIG
jgi:hypothetical protein